MSRVTRAEVALGGIPDVVDDLADESPKPTPTKTKTPAKPTESEELSA